MNSSYPPNYWGYWKFETFKVLVKNTRETGLDYPSKLQFNYPRTIDRERLKEHLGVVSGKRIGELRKAW